MPIRGLGTVYAFDLGRLTGFCYGRPGEPPVSGSWTLYKSSEGIEQGFANFLDCVQTLFEGDRPSLVVWATPPTPQAFKSFGSSTSTIKSLYGYPAILAAATKRFQAWPKEIHEATARKHFMGKGRMGTREATKSAVLSRCHLLEYFPVSVRDEDRADACCLWSWGCAEYGITDKAEKFYLFGEQPNKGAKKRGKRSRLQYRPLV